MSHHIDIGGRADHPRLAAPQTLQQALDRLRARPRRNHMPARNPTRVLDRKLRFVSGPLDLALPKTSRRIVGQRLSNFVETALLAAGAGVENEHLHRHELPGISMAKSSPGFPAYRPHARECTACAPPVCCAGTA